MTDFEADAQAAARQAAREAVAAILGRDGWTPAALQEIGETYVLGLGTLVEMALRQAAETSGAVACKAGCASCCFQTVLVTEPEAFLLARHLERTLAAEALARLRTATAATAARIRGMDAVRRLKARVPCPLLDLRERRCTVYAVRPLACRAYHSKRRTACEAALRKPGRGPSIPCYRLPYDVTFGLRAGLADAFAAGGRPSRDLELIAALAAIWSADRAEERWAEERRAEECWIGGADLFAAAAADETAAGC